MDRFMLGMDKCSELTYTGSITHVAVKRETASRSKIE